MSHIEVEDIILPADPEYVMLGENWDDYFYVIVMFIAVIKIIGLLRS